MNAFLPRNFPPFKLLAWRQNRTLKPKKRNRRFYEVITVPRNKYWSPDMTNPYSYHCICTTFVLVTRYDLTRLPERGEPGLDKAIILPTQNSDDPRDQQTIMTNLAADRQPAVVRREDGFERRTLLRCQRCKLAIGYRLDEAQFKNGSAHAQDVVYILPGALMSTEDMVEGKTPAQSAAWAAQARAV